MVRDILKIIFKTRGYEISGDEILSAKKDNSEIVLAYKDGKPNEEELSKLFSIESKTKIFVSSDFFDDKLKNIAKSRGIILWDREILKKEIGECVLLNPLFFFQPEKIDKKKSKELIIKPKIKKYEINKEIIKKLGAPIISLELIPCHVYSYECELLIEGSLDTEFRKGVIYVNGKTKALEEIDENIELIEEIEYPYTKQNSVLSSQELYDIAKHAVIDKHTKIVEMKNDKSVAVIYEKRKIKPKEDAVNVEYKETYYLPIWVAESKSGEIKINAFNGKIITEVLSRTNIPIDEKKDVI